MGLAAIFRTVIGHDADDPRQSLRDAIARRAPAQAELVAAQSALQRVRAVIDAVSDAKAQADAASEQAAQATRRWALDGARTDVPAGDQALIDSAAAARLRYQGAHLQAEGAKAALDELEHRVQAAEIALGQVNDAVRAEVVNLLVHGNRLANTRQ